MPPSGIVGVLRRGSSWWLSIAMIVYISISVEKISACTKFSRPSSSSIADRDDHDRQRRDDAERDLAAEDVAEESHRQRDRLDELEQELDQPDEQGDDAAPMPSLNPLNEKNLPR